MPQEARGCVHREEPGCCSSREAAPRGAEAGQEDRVKPGPQGELVQSTRAGSRGLEGK